MSGSRGNRQRNKDEISPAASTPGTEQCNHGDPVTRSDLESLLDKQRETFKLDVATLIKKSADSLKASVESLGQQLQSFDGRLTKTETLAGDNFAKLALAETQVELLQTQNKELLDRVESLENNANKSMLRIVGIPEGSESGSDPAKFVAELLKEVMGTDVFPTPPTLDYVYRSGGKTDQKNRVRPRTMVVCFHYMQEKERAAKWSRKHECWFRDTQLRFYAHTTVALAKRCAAYNPIKKSLYDKGIRTRIVSGARLQITFHDETVTFHSPEEAKTFYDQRINVLPETPDSPGAE
ncbi:LINE-1 type transposase domain-containing 1 [Xyrichtys novacula]|uniref:LINE-1 type transposase domain-containing 1 n=1 Tax=Xyrichtys novacula TaxID=13765 RepID=A0AAV1FN69_XYRNO|nr:LINE-1 type transposase domain-containing 1 [Xyrichtys novacula]